MVIGVFSFNRYTATNFILSIMENYGAIDRIEKGDGVFNVFFESGCIISWIPPGCTAKQIKVYKAYVDKLLMKDKEYIKYIKAALPYGEKKFIKF